jgi:hypothetical protein
MIKKRTMKKLMIVLWGIFVTGSFIACSEEETTEPALPTAVVETPVDGQVFMRGSTLMLTADFTAEAGLKECTVYLKEASQLKGWDDPWTPEQTIPLDGKNQRIENQYLFEPSIPTDIKSTDYILVVLVVDSNLEYATYEIPITID